MAPPSSTSTRIAWLPWTSSRWRLHLRFGLQRANVTADESLKTWRARRLRLQTHGSVERRRPSPPANMPLVPALRRRIHSRNQRVMLCSTRKNCLVVGGRELVVFRRACAERTTGSLGGLSARWDIVSTSIRSIEFMVTRRGSAAFTRSREWSRVGDPIAASSRSRPKTP
jgi:hypothetical protein